MVLGKGSGTFTRGCCYQGYWRFERPEVMIISMRLIIRYPHGPKPAIVLATIGPRIRLSIPGCDDAVEIRLADNRWLAEDGTPIEVDFNVPDHEFNALIERTASGCVERSDALEVYLWAACVPPAPPSSARVN